MHDFLNKFLKKKNFQNTFLGKLTKNFWHANFGNKGGGAGRVGGIRWKKKICDQSIFQIMLYKVLKSCLKKIPADIETDVKPRKYQNKKNGTNAL